MRISTASVVLALHSSAAFGCSNLLVSKGASKHASVIGAYNADSGELYGSLGLYPKATHKAGDMRDMWDWDAATYLGQIPEPAETYNVVGNTNEHGLIIGETTFGGLEDLDSHGSGGIMDYGSLIWTTLQRARTADEAITVMDNLAQAYGYASDGESFFIADADSIWLMELIGKGKHEKGAVWVAERVPDGYVGSTANQARIRTFNHTDPANTRYAKDVVTFAQKVGLYPNNATAADFSFSDVYDPVTFSGARFCEARVWHLLNPVCNGCLDGHLDYAQGYNLTNRMPLFVKAEKKLDVSDAMSLMRTHFEGTWFDTTGTMRPDIGSGSGHSPYRRRPLMWNVDGDNYVNERTVGTQQTGWSFVAESRSWLPEPIRAALWFAPDDSSTSLKTPVYGSATKVPPSFGDRYGQMPNAKTSDGVEGDAFNMSLDSAFWVYNLLSNLAYGDRSLDTLPQIKAHIEKRQPELFDAADAMERKYVQLVAQEKHEAASALVDDFVVSTGEDLTKEVRDVWMKLFAHTRDGFRFTNPKQKVCRDGETEGCTFRPVPASDHNLAYPDEFYRRIVNDGDNKEHYHVPAGADNGGDHVSVARANARKMMRMDKIRV